MDYSHYLYLRQEVDVERMMAREDARLPEELSLTLLTILSLRGMTVTSGSVTLKKDDSNLIGISIGGGAPLCPCLYMVQVFDNTPAARDATLEAGDELVGVNGVNVKVKLRSDQSHLTS